MNLRTKITGFGIIVAAILGGIAIHHKSPRVQPRDADGSSAHVVEPNHSIVESGDIRGKEDPEREGKKEMPKELTFIPFEKAPEEKLINDPKLGEVVEITLENGAKVYRFNDKVYSVKTGKTYSKAFAKMKEDPK